MSDPHKLSILILDPDSDFTESLIKQGSKKNVNFISRPYSSRERPSLDDLIFETFPDIVILNLDVDDELNFADPVGQILKVPMPIPPIVLGTTARDSIALKTRAYKLGIDDFMVRPFTAADVWLRLDVLMRTRRLQRQLDSATRKLSATNLRLFSSNRHLEEMTLTDELTGLNNMRFMTQFLEKQFQLFARYDRSFSVMMIDLDHFKSVNDSNDHLVGSETIRIVGKLIHEATRGSDIKARYGGDEYIVAMPETDGPTAKSVGERIRASIESKDFYGSDGKQFRVTSSIGVGSFVKDRHKTYQDIIRDSDFALYMAKRNGRNRVELYDVDMQKMQNQEASEGYDQTQSAVFTEIKKIKSGTGT